MGSSSTKVYRPDVELAPYSKRPSTRSKHPSDYKRRHNIDDPSDTTPRPSFDSDDIPIQRRSRKSRHPVDDTRNARVKAAGAARNNDQRRTSDLDARRLRDQPREPRSSVRQHRSHKDVTHHHSSKTSANGNKVPQISYTDFDSNPRSPRAQRRHRKEKAVLIETTELNDQITTKECVICADHRSVDRFATQLPTAECTHEVNTCRKCLRQWIQSSFKTKLWDQITCPECGKRLQYKDVQTFATPPLFKRYDELATRAALEAIDGFRWCIAKGCKSGQVHEHGDAMPRFKCVSCKASHCVVHGVPWHAKETCAEYDYRTDGKQKKKEEAASKKWIKESAKKCPNCKRHIEKASGCDHMTCSKCRHEFCWLCLAPFELIRRLGNSMHRSGCEYYDGGERTVRAYV